MKRRREENDLSLSEAFTACPTRAGIETALGFTSKLGNGLRPPRAHVALPLADYLRENTKNSHKGDSTARTGG
jgi:hypothetical protein